jgi:hypothetical protein
MLKRLVHFFARPFPPAAKTAIWRCLIGLRYRIHTSLGKYPAVLFRCYRLLNLYQDQAVGQHSEVVIDAFPRSASTFAYYAFQVAQGRPVKIAHHLHVPAQIIRACELHLPTLVLIRDPKEAVSSLVVREPYMSLKACLKRYLVFYKTLEPYRGQFILADFKEVTTDFGNVIKRLNERYRTDYAIFQHTEQNMTQVIMALRERDQEYGGRAFQSYAANPTKEALKKCVDFGGSQKLLQRCQQLYQRCHRHIGSGAS